MTNTIMMTISHGLVSRNLLRNNFFKLIKQENIKLVIVTSAADDKKFQDEFGSEKVILEKMLSNKHRPVRERIINLLHSSTMYNGTTEIKFKIREGKDKFIKLRSISRKVLAFFFGKSVLIRKLISVLDEFLLIDKVNDKLFDKYNPSILFCTSMLFSKEIDMIKSAKKRNIPVVGMVKSWDQLVKDIPIRLQPDLFLVWNEAMKYQAIHDQLFASQKVRMVGIPQFDIYEKVKNENNCTRKQFMESIKADPKKKLLLFAAEGKWSPSDPEFVKIIANFIKKNKLEYKCHLHVRPHFCFKNFLKPLFKLQDRGIVSVDTTWNKTKAFVDNWDPSYKDMIHLANSMKFADIVITTPSTIVLDATYFNKPIVNIGFDECNRKDNEISVKLLYNTEYYKRVMKYDATHYVVNKEQLLLKINELLKNKNKKIPNQKKLQRDYITYMDGRSGERIAKNILHYVKM